MKVKPDSVFILINQHVADLISREPERFRSKLVTHEGRKLLEIGRTSLCSDPENNTTEAISQLVAAVRDCSPEAGRFRADFYTTTVKEKRSAEIVLLHLLRPYFNYSMSSVAPRSKVPPHFFRFSDNPNRSKGPVLLDGPELDWQVLHRHVTWLNNLVGNDFVLEQVLQLTLQLLNMAAGEAVDPAIWPRLNELLPAKTSVVPFTFDGSHWRFAWGAPQVGVVQQAPITCPTSLVPRGRRLLLRIRDYWMIWSRPHGG